MDMKAVHHRVRGIYDINNIKAELAEKIDIRIHPIKRLDYSSGIFCVHKRKFKVTSQSNQQKYETREQAGRSIFD